MKLSTIREILDATVLSGEEHLDREVLAACGSDFMSDVLAYVKDQALLLTGLVNPQVVRTAEMLDMKCIDFVRGKMPTSPSEAGSGPGHCGHALAQADVRRLRAALSQRTEGGLTLWSPSN